MTGGETRVRGETERGGTKQASPPPPTLSVALEASGTMGPTRGSPGASETERGGTKQASPPPPTLSVALEASGTLGPARGSPGARTAGFAKGGTQTGEAKTEGVACPMLATATGAKGPVEILEAKVSPSGLRAPEQGDASGRALSSHQRWALKEWGLKQPGSQQRCQPLAHLPPGFAPEQPEML